MLKIFAIKLTLSDNLKHQDSPDDKMLFVSHATGDTTVINFSPRRKGY